MLSGCILSDFLSESKANMANTYFQLSRHENQALRIGEYAIAFCRGELSGPSPEVVERTELFHLDSVGCAVAALACRMNAPVILREEALTYPFANGACCFGSSIKVQPEKAVVANCSAVRELDANGTNFGYNPRTGQMRGEFGHNDFYPVVVAAAQQSECEGATLVRGMICLDEIRGRLAEAFALKDHKIDHVVHGALASAAVYGALMGASAEQIESALGLVLAHYIPFRAIRAGHQLSDSKGASAAISSEVAVLSMRRAMRGFVGPRDIFRNPQAIFCLFEKPQEPHAAPFDLEFATGGDDFAVMGMHFKLGLYEHQSAGALAGVIGLLEKHPTLLEDPNAIETLRITIYEPAFGIIGDPAKRDPRTRQSADHSMVYIVATLLRKAFESKRAGWRELILVPQDYDEQALFHSLTRRFMEKIEFVHGGDAYDRRYPDGIPTTVEIRHKTLGDLSSGLVMYPEGHARCPSARLESLLEHKFARLASLGVEDYEALRQRLSGLNRMKSTDIKDLYAFPIEPCETP
jgi:2-methylcitrate dehydratase